VLRDAFTLVIPTHYRHRLLRRVLSYYKDSGLNILVIDSTNTEFPDPGLFPGVDYRSFKDVRFLDKIRGPILEVATPYLAFCADDSFLVPRAIAACVEFLEANPGYSAAHGRQVAVAHREGGLAFAPCYVEDEAMRIDADRPGERLVQLYSPYSPTFYAVHRTGSMQDFVRTASGRAINDVMLELVSAMVFAINGRHKVLPVFYHVTEIVPSVLDRKGARLPGADDICTRPEHKEAFRIFVDAVAEFLSRRGGESPEAARREVLAAMEVYIANNCPRRRRKPFWRKLPKWFLRAISGTAPRADGTASLERTWEIEGREVLEREQGFADWFAQRFDAQALAELSAIRGLLEGYYAPQ
jgi:glycosyltransferase domain-containing protein